jgi:hypothetical protein
MTSTTVTKHTSKPRKPKRIDQFVIDRPAFAMGAPFYPDLLSSALELLQRALMDRGSEATQNSNHFTKHSTSAIVLVVTAFDVWLSDVAFAVMRDTEDMKALLNESGVPAKYRALYDRIHPGETTDLNELEIVAEVRNEIVHHFRRPSQNYLPAWVPILEKSNILPVFGHPETDWTLTDKLSSYSLAYWAFQIIEKFVIKLVHGAPGRVQMERHAIPQFGQYRHICAPARLQDLDKLRGTGKRVNAGSARIALFDPSDASGARK